MMQIESSWIYIIENGKEIEKHPRSPWLRIDCDDVHYVGNLGAAITTAYNAH
jgi:hypothetical protein